MAIIHVDGKQFEVDGADNLLHACLSLGLDIPYFCWHPALGSVGACRQCAVKQYRDASDTQGRLVMSCMTPATDNTYISIGDKEAVEFRESVISWLMSNHPHDCPVCEEGGHCHLQDMTVMTGHASRSYRFTKRTHVNQDLGPFINHEMNRCIACYRCVRYYKDYAGGTDLGVYGSASRVYFGRETDGTLESEFAGNLTEVCPTGVFTDKTHSERYNRKWDMQYAPSVCQGCAVGCNISPGERYGELRRVENRYNGEVNGYFLCDRGRFGAGYVNRKDRPRQPELSQHGTATVLTTDTALSHGGELLRHARRVIGIGSPRASLESNYALRLLVGAANYSTGIAAEELALIDRVAEILKTSPAHTPSVREIESCDAAFVLGEDVTQTAPRIALALRQTSKGKAVQMTADKHLADWQAEAIANIGQHEKSPVYIASCDATRLDDIATATLRAAPEDLARLGFAVANAIDSNAPAVDGLDADTQALAGQIAAALLAAKKPLIVSGTGAASDAVLQASANIAAALKARGLDAQLTLSVPEANSLGVALLGGASLDDALKQLAAGEADMLVVVENDLYRRAPKALVDAALAKAGTIIVIDHQRTETLAKATLSLPAGSFAEADGTLVSMEGRVQRFFQIYDPAYYDPSCQIAESWHWLHALQSQQLAKSKRWVTLDDVTAEIAEDVPSLAAVRDAAPGASFRIQGRKLARQPHRYSGRTAMRAKLSVHEPRAPQDADTALAFSMEGYSGPAEPGPLVPFAWAPGWNSPQSWNKFQDEVGGHLKAGDPGVRLFEGGSAAPGSYYGPAPAAFAPRAQGLRLVPLPSIFGSDELTSRAAPIVARMSAAALALSPADAGALGLAEGAKVSVSFDGYSLQLPVRLSATLPQGTAGLPVGFPGVPMLTGAQWAELSTGVTA